MDKHRISTAGGKCLYIIKALNGHSVKGLCNKELCQMLGESPSSINRSIATLMHSNFVQQMKNGRYRLGAAMLEIAAATIEEIERERKRLDNLEKIIKNK